MTIRDIPHILCDEPGCGRRQSYEPEPLLPGYDPFDEDLGQWQRVASPGGERHYCGSHANWRLSLRAIEGGDGGGQ